MNKETRKKEISKILFLRGHVHIKELAELFCVSERTIERDVVALSHEHFPLYTRTGRYNSGIFLLSSGKRTDLFATELFVLKKIEKAIEGKNIILLTNEEEQTLKAMINMIADK